MSNKNAKAHKGVVLSITELVELLRRVSAADIHIKAQGVAIGEQTVTDVCLTIDVDLGGTGISYCISFAVLGEDPDPFIPEIGYISTDGESIVLHSRDNAYAPIALHFSKRVEEKVMARDLY